MKKILGISLVAMMAVTTARADIVSKAYVDVDQTKTYNVITRTAKTGVQIEELDAKMGALPSNKTVAEAISEAVSGGIENVVTHEGAVGTATQPVYITEQGVATAITSYPYANLTGTPTIDSAVTENSTNAVQSGAVFTELAAKADASDLSNYVQTSSVTNTYAADGTAPVTGTAVASAISSATISESQVTGLTTDLAAKEATANKTAEANAATDLADNAKKDVNYPTLAAAKAIADAAVNGAASNYEAAGTAAGLIADLDASEVTGVIKAISQADGVISATAGTIANADVASNAAIGLSKIAMPSLSDLSTTGTVVLTAKAGTGEQAGQVVYAWETIER